jgi:hypothetical protein
MTCCIAPSTAIDYTNVNSLPGRDIGDAQARVSSMNTAGTVFLGGTGAIPQALVRPWSQALTCSAHVDMLEACQR